MGSYDEAEHQRVRSFDLLGKKLPSKSSHTGLSIEHPKVVTPTNIQAAIQADVLTPINVVTLLFYGWAQRNNRQK
jgi:hypothetical protein